MVVWAAGRSVHHSRVDGNVMAVVERENSSLPLYHPIVCQPGRDSIRQPSDCELVLPLTGYCQPAAYCYCCHFSVVSYDSISAYWNYAKTEVFTKCALLLISSFSQTRRRDSHVCAHVFTHMHTELWRPSFFPPTPYTVALFFLLPAELLFPQLFMSHLLGQVLRQMCVK